MKRDYQTTTEAELGSLLRAGDDHAFKEIYDRYKVRITSNLFAILKDRDLVEETLQELFFRLWEKRDQLNPAQPILGFLFRMATNLAHDHFRKLGRSQRLAEAFWDTVMIGNDAGDACFQKEVDETLHHVIDQLPPQRKRVFLLCKFESKSYSEVSELLGISVAAVNDHMTKANKFLKTRFPKEAYLASYLFACYVVKGLV